MSYYSSYNNFSQSAELHPIFACERLSLSRMPFLYLTCDQWTYLLAECSKQVFFKLLLFVSRAVWNLSVWTVSIACMSNTIRIIYILKYPNFPN